MKKGFLIGFLILMVLPVAVFAGNKSPWETKLPFKAASIQYTISGMENGIEVTYVRDYGKEVASYHTSKTSMMGMVMVNETVDITTPDWIYSFDLTNNTGTQQVNPEKYMVEEYYKLSKTEQRQVRENGEKMGVSVAEGFGGNVQQNAEKILGYSCDRAEMMGTIVYSIHGTDIPLRMKSNMMGMNMKMEATSVDVGKVASKFFQLPEGIEPRLDPQSDAIARSMAKETIDMLKDPKGAEKMQAEVMEERMRSNKKTTPEQQEQMEQAMKMLKDMFGDQKKQ